MGQLLKRQEEFIRYALFGIAAVAADVLVYALTVGASGHSACQCPELACRAGGCLYHQ